MYKSILVSSDPQVTTECSSIVSEIGNIQLSSLNKLDELEQVENDYNHLFILISDFSNLNAKKVRLLRNFFPTVPFILYHRSFFTSSLESINDLSDIHIIIGENRLTRLRETLLKIKDSHWRRLPLEDFNIDRDRLSKRMQRAIHFIEENKLDSCTLVNIAKYAGLSAGYFSQEFKRETGYSFRSFIQRVLVYYEEEIFPKLDLSAVNMARLLGYSELSSFSRSFKKRQGISPAAFIKKNKIH